MYKNGLKVTGDSKLLSLQSLGLQKDLTIGMFTVWEHGNHWSEIWILQHIIFHLFFKNRAS